MQKIAITWSGRIDPLGNPLEAAGILGVVDSSTLYLRRDDGQSFPTDCRVEVTHSLSSEPLVLIYRSDFDWEQWVSQ